MPFADAVLRCQRLTTHHPFLLTVRQKTVTIQSRQAQ